METKTKIFEVRVPAQYSLRVEAPEGVTEQYVQERVFDWLVESEDSPWHHNTPLGVGAISFDSTDDDAEGVVDVFEADASETAYAVDLSIS